MVCFYYKNIYKARCTKGLKKCKYKQWIVLFRKMQRCVQTNFHNALSRVIQFKNIVEYFLPYVQDKLYLYATKYATKL